MLDKIKNTSVFLREFSIPLILGIIAAIVWANLDLASYKQFIFSPFGGDSKMFGHPFNFSFLMNDIFMTLFFGVVAVEITLATSKGGSLNPITKAMNPLISAIGGIVFPVILFFTLISIFIDPSDYPDIAMKSLYNGWAIPTATDIALAWLAAVFILGKKHPAIAFLLLIAIADDAIGLGIIAIFYPDPKYPVEPTWLLLCLLGISVSYLLRRIHIQSFLPYVVFGGGLCWIGLVFAHLHPALALILIVPFMPSTFTGSSKKLFANRSENKNRTVAILDFEHNVKWIVDFGLFGFGLANAGVLFSSVNSITWIILISLIVGKTVGITLFALIAHLCGFKLDKNINISTLILVSMIAGIGLTVALFVSNVAYEAHPTIKDAAKMGALFSILSFFIAFILSKFLLKPHKKITRTR